MINEINELKKLKDDGTLTDEEFQKAKDKLLGNEPKIKNEPLTAPIPPKKPKKLLRIILILIILFAVIPMIIEQLQPRNIDVILDATQFFNEDKTKTISEEELIKKLGTPDDIAEWNNIINDISYPIKTLDYGNYSYHFNNNMLMRISINEPIEFKNKNDILAMFGLKKYSNSKIIDTNSAYRVYNCGVADFWAGYTNNKLEWVKITYGLFK